MTTRAKIGRWIIFALSLPLILGWLVPLILCCVRLASWSSLRWEPTGVLSATWTPWAAARWRYSTTIMRSIVYQAHARSLTPEPTTRTGRHEHVHVRQFEDVAIAGLLQGLLALALPPAHEWWVLWAGAAAFLSVGWVTAWLRGGSAYRDAEIERSAYAQTDLPWSQDRSWLEGREAILDAERGQ